MLENLYSLQSTWMWVGTAKAESHVVCINCSFKHKLHYYSYIQQRIFSIKRKRRQKSWFIFPLYRNCNISLWLFPPLSEEISAIKIAPAIITKTTGKISVITFLGMLLSLLKIFCKSQSCQHKLLMIYHWNQEKVNRCWNRRKHK